MDTKLIRIPMINQTPVVMDVQTLPLYAPANELIIIRDLVEKELEPEIRRHIYHSPMSSDSGVIVIGAEILARVNITKKPVPDHFYFDASSSYRYRGYGIIFSGEAKGITILSSRPKIYEVRSKPEPPFTDRQRMTQAHLESVGKLLAANGIVQKGEYKDGWMACLRSMAQLLGIEVPSYVPFKDMRMNILSEDELKCQV